MKIARFDPAPCGFPKPYISPLPNRLSFLPLGNWLPVFSRRKKNGQFKSFRCGRYALNEAYQLSGLGSGTTLLAPAYHCLAMLDPAVNLGANVLLYPVRADLSPDLEKLEKIARNCVKPIKALLATHFFGIPQNFDDLKMWCDEHGIVLIEDCSHALFTENFQATGTGIFGKYVVSSTYKFFCCANGGLLYANEDRFLNGVRTKALSLIAELRAIKRLIEKHRSNTVLPSAEKIGELLTALSGTATIPAELQIVQYVSPSPSFSAARTGTAALRSTDWLLRLSPIEENIRKRRRNFQRWIEAVRGLPNCHALYSDLLEDCVPYMFPLYIDHPETHFYRLKHLGMPVWRWDDMAVSSCLTANKYRLHLLHLPCHQSLSDEQMAWMIDVVQKVMQSPVTIGK